MRRITAVLVAGAFLGCASLAEAQAVLDIGSDPGSSVRTRAELQRLLSEYEQALASPAYSDNVKRAIQADAEAIRGRLQLGDFRVGDRIVLYVQGETELPDTLTVEPGPRITLPLFGEIPLAGVLRSEVQAHLTDALARFIREPVVRANGLMRLAVIGQVARPGFYTMPAETLLGEALMVAGGPTPASNLEELRIDRGTARLLEGIEIQEAMRQGLTLDQLNLQAGDQIVIPERTAGGGFLTSLGIIAGVIGSVGTVLFLILR